MKLLEGLRYISSFLQKIIMEIPFKIVVAVVVSVIIIVVIIVLAMFVKSSGQEALQYLWNIPEFIKQLLTKKGG